MAPSSSGEDIGLSRQEHGFESRRGHLFFQSDERVSWLAVNQFFWVRIPALERIHTLIGVCFY